MAGLAIAYMVLGAGWLYLKGNTRIEQFVRRSFFWLVPAQLFVTVVGVAYAIASVHEMHTAVDLHQSPLLTIASAFVVAAVAVFPSLRRQTELLPFLLGLGTFLLGIAALSTAIYPDIVPFRLSLWEAAASRPSQLFVLIGASVVAPVVIAYSLFAYWIFRGKTPDQGWES